MTLAHLRCLPGLLAAACAMGCASHAPVTDAAFGRVVRQSLAQQIANPEAGRQAGDGGGGFDAQSARHALAKHRDSFKTPPPTFTIFGLGGGAAQ